MGAGAGGGTMSSTLGSPVRAYDFLLKFLLVGDSDVGKGEILASLQDGAAESPYGHPAGERGARLEGSRARERAACREERDPENARGPGEPMGGRGANGGPAGRSGARGVRRGPGSERRAKKRKGTERSGSGERAAGGGSRAQAPE